MVHPELERTVTPLLDRISCPADMACLDDDDLVRLAGELRSELISTVSRTGGHLGSGLGVVELTIAIHSVFSTPHDKLIWDVSHQCYPHKILTGRRERMGTLRKRGGLSGFTRRAESSYDPFGAAHSSTSISAGLGFATARDLGGEGGEVICVIGDGAMSAGMAFEAINNAGTAGRRMFVILNDNAMSISEPVGAFSRWLQQLRDAGNKVAAEIPQGADCDAARFFNTLGFAYRGPVDGHDLPALLNMLRVAKAEATGPVLLHVRTRKGAGYSHAEDSDDKFHGVSRFDIATGVQVKPVAKASSYTEVFAGALIGEARRDRRIVAITAAMASGTGLDDFGRVFPDRTFDVGIAEQHAVTFAAGLAAGGMRPFCAIYSTFLQRGYDQLVHDVALQGLPVRFAIDRAGLVGADGATHAGSFDIAYLGNLPGFVVMAASDEAELCRMVATAVAHDSGPIAFRYPRGEGVGIALPKSPRPLKIGKGRVIEEGRTVALLSLGTRLGECREAARLLAARGISTTIADARFARPLDTSLVETLVGNHELLVTVEEGAEGGFGAIVLQHLAEQGLLDGRCAVRTKALPGKFIHHGAPHEMYSEAGLDAAGIYATVCNALGIDRFSALRGIDTGERVAAPA